MCVMDDSSRGFPVHARQADVQTGLKEEFALFRSEIHFCIDGGVRGKTQLPLCSSSGHGADKADCCKPRRFRLSAGEGRQRHR